jgi:thiol-disulfide isomerase/thioredoxin
VKIRLSHAVILALVLSLPAAGWAGFTLTHRTATAGGGPPPLPEFSPSAPNLPAPDAAFTDDAGQSVRLADFRGRVILVNLWATWCQPCVKEMPALDRLAAAMKDTDFAIVAVSQDRGGAHIVDPFFAKLDLKALKTYLDPKSLLGEAFAVRGLPTSILIDRDGTEIGRLEGAEEWDGPQAQALLRWYVARGKKSPDEPIKAAQG